MDVDIGEVTGKIYSFIPNGKSKRVVSISRMF